MATSDALDLESGVFKSGSAKEVARSLKRSADKSHRRKAAPYRSAMSMLSFYINRGGKQLSATRRKVLEQAKDELRRLYGHEPTGSHEPATKRKPRASPARKSRTTSPSPARKKATARPKAARKPAAKKRASKRA
jgi:hypothetical protein